MYVNNVFLTKCTGTTQQMYRTLTLENTYIGLHEFRYAAYVRRAFRSDSLPGLNPKP
jgi:hypothetical protein